MNDPAYLANVAKRVLASIFCLAGPPGFYRPPVSFGLKPPNAPNAAISGSKLRPKGTSKTYVDSECGFKFEYSKVWTVTKEAVKWSTDECEYRISFARKSSHNTVARHRVGIVVLDHEFAGLAHEDVFEFKEGKWYEDRGAAGEGEAYEIRGANWVGMSMPSSPMRCYGKDGVGPYQGAESSPRAVLFSQTFKRMAELDGGECEEADDEGLELVVSTFEFIPVIKAAESRK